MTDGDRAQQQDALAALDEALACGATRAELEAQVPGLAAALAAHPPLVLSDRMCGHLVSLTMLGTAVFCFSLAAVLGVVLAAMLGLQGPALHLEAAWDAVTERWLDWRGYDPFHERCLLATDDVFKHYLDLFRPPQDCAFCRNVSNVERVSNISSAQFERRFAYSAVPVVVTDATAQWMAAKTFSFDFFRAIYAEESPALAGHEEDCQFFPYRSKFRSLADVFRMPVAQAEQRPGTTPWYVGWSNCDSVAANILRKYYARPYFLPASAESSKTDWIFMGSPGYGANMHVDNVKNPSWQAQIRGVKTWTLMPPLECRYACPSPLTVTVQPGEVIVLDTNVWYHSTVIQPGDMSITIGSEFD